MYRLRTTSVRAFTFGLIASALLSGCGSSHHTRPTIKAAATTIDGIALTSFVPNLVPAYLTAPSEKSHLVSQSLASPMICEPVVGTGLPVTVAQFGSGCSRWLQFNVGGLPQVGCTPRWYSFARACAETNRPDLRLEPQDITGFTRVTGVNIMVLSSITGTPSNLIVTYRLFDTHTQQPFDKPLVLKGTTQAIVAKLPEIAAQLAKLLGVHGAHLPNRVEVSPADLTLMGGIPWVPATDLDEVTRQRLIKLSRSSGLAVRLLLWVGSNRGRVTASLDSHPLPDATSNVLLIQGYYDKYHRLPTNKSVFDGLLRQFPTNLAMNSTAAYLSDLSNKQSYSVQLAKRITEIAPNQPYSWVILSDCISNEADAIRQGRYSYEMSYATSNEVQTLYREELKAAERSVALDPAYGHAWYEVQLAAMFRGDSNLAWSAFAKASKLDRDVWEPYSTALEMAQFKWFGNRIELIRLANRTAAHFHYDRYAMKAATQLWRDGYKNVAHKMMTTIIKKNLALLAHSPNNAEALYALGSSYRIEHEWAVSTIYYARLTRLRPYYGRAYTRLGDSYMAVNLCQPAYDALKKATELSPLNEDAFERMAEACFRLGHYHQAETAAKRALSIQPSAVFPLFYAGDSLLMLSKYKQALPYLQESIQLYPRDFHTAASFAFWRVLGNCQLGLGQYHQAINSYKTCLAEKATCFPALNNMAACYNDLHQYNLGIACNRQALQLEPKSPYSWAGLAYALYESHNVAGARQAWENVVNFGGNGRLAAVARKDLALTSKHAPASKPR